VRLQEGNFATETPYNIAPAALVRRYHALGARWLHVVDLDGARDGVTINTPVIERLARHPAMCLQVGGGVRTADVIERLLSAGVARVVIGSAAVDRPAEVATWLKCFGNERICLAFDVRMGVHQPQVHTHGWTRNSVVTLWDAISAYPPGLVKHVLSTAIDRDGTLRGPNLALYRHALKVFPHLEWQASGGIRHAVDLAALARLGVASAVTGKALLEERIAVKELRPFLPAALSPA
jgi:phosphoribosylformimino-5-aminoimidazole carboxamide ribotide isomerase